MPEGPFGFSRATSLGPFVEPDEFEWVINDELAHHIHQTTLESDEVGFGSFTILLQTFMNFFPDRSETDSLNNWYLTRDQFGGYDRTEWLQAGSLPKIERPEDLDREVRSDILFDTSVDNTNPKSVKVTSQQYTVHGALFTYEFDQDEDEQEARAFIRVPVHRELSEEGKDIADGTVFEYFEFQTREYRSDFAERGLGDLQTFFHPHFRSREITSTGQAVEFMNRAFNIMEKSVEVEMEEK